MLPLLASCQQTFAFWWFDYCFIVHPNWERGHTETTETSCLHLLFTLMWGNVLQAEFFFSPFRWHWENDVTRSMNKRLLKMCESLHSFMCVDSFSSHGNFEFLWDVCLPGSLDCTRTSLAGHLSVKSLNGAFVLLNAPSETDGFLTPEVLGQGQVWSGRGGP